MQEVKAVKLAIMTFTITKEKLISINVRIDNMVALSYLMNIGDTKKTGISHLWQRNLGLPLAPQDHNYYRVPTKGVECKKPTGNPGI